MQMHDYARKPRGRKVFSGRREGEAESREAGKRGRGEEGRRREEGGGEGRKGGVERKRDNVCYWGTSFLSPSLSTFRPFPSLAHPPLFHLSNLNAYRRLSSPRLAVLSAEITSALTDLWEARSGRPVVKPLRHVTYTSQDEYSCFVNFFFLSFSKRQS